MIPPAPRPRKRLGQHFLIDPNIVRKIVALAEVRPHETVLEIGPGRGILTRPLCAAARTVIAIEKDPRLGDYLTRAVADCRNLDLRVADASAFPFASLSAPVVLVADLAY